MPLALEIERSGDADDAGTDDRHFAQFDIPGTFS
jgi:hypothetical protein